MQHSHQTLPQSRILRSWMKFSADTLRASPPSGPRGLFEAAVTASRSPPCWRLLPAWKGRAFSRRQLKGQSPRQRSPASFARSMPLCTSREPLPTCGDVVNCGADMWSSSASFSAPLPSHCLSSLIKSRFPATENDRSAARGCSPCVTVSVRVARAALMASHDGYCGTD